MHVRENEREDRKRLRNQATNLRLARLRQRPGVLEPRRSHPGYSVMVLVDHAQVVCTGVLNVDLLRPALPAAAGPARLLALVGGGAEGWQG